MTGEVAVVAIHLLPAADGQESTGDLAREHRPRPARRNRHLDHPLEPVMHFVHTCGTRGRMRVSCSLLGRSRGPGCPIRLVLG